MARHGWLVLMVQGVLTWVPFALFGARWEAGVGGLLAGLGLLAGCGRLPWQAAPTPKVSPPGRVAVTP